MQVHCSPYPLRLLVLLAILSSLFIAIRTHLTPQTLTFMCFFLWCFLPFCLSRICSLRSFLVHTSFKIAASFTLLYQPIPEVSKVCSLHHLIYKFPFSNTLSATPTPSSFPASTQERSLLAFKNSNHVLVIPLWVSLWLDMKTILLQVFNNLST